MRRRDHRSCDAERPRQSVCGWTGNGGRSPRLCRAGRQGLIGMPGRRIDLGTVLGFAERSDTGRKRPHNEDRVATDPPHGIAVLADGMGGHKGGEIASALAVETVTRELATRLRGIATESPDDEAYAPESLLARDVVN